MAGNVTGTQGWNPFTSLSNATYTIRTASQTPPQITDVSPTDGSFYVDPTNMVSFTVNSLSGIQTTNIKLTLNGVARTLSFTGTTASWQVRDTSPLAGNVIYTAVITAKDIDNNSATNTFGFNTWLATNPFFEAEDYNYSSGHFIDNFGNLPPADHNLYAGLFGSNGVDYLEYDLSGTNNAWRVGDLPQTETSTDVDHNLFAANGYQDYNLSFIENGEWQNYTRRLSNATYSVYARMAGFGNNPTMLFERLANATASSSNQPRASLGTFVCPNTGGAQNWTFVPLKDFFSSNVLVRFPGTNTFRCTSLAADQTYNFTYLLLVPSTSTNALRPYVSSGFPYPGAGNVEPDQAISVTIANQQTNPVATATIKLLVNGTEVTGSLVLSTNAAGTVVSYQPTSLYPLGADTTVKLIFNDNIGPQTNQWTFAVANILSIPTAYALNSPGGSNGFTVHIVKARDNAPPADFPPTSARAEAHLAGLIIDTNTSLPYVNQAAGPSGNGIYAETNTINYEQCGVPSDDGDTFTNNAPFPYVDLTPYQTFGCSHTNGPDFISIAIGTYIYLQPGIYRWAVRSDDGFRLTTGTGAAPTNTLVMDYEGGRSSANPSVFEFIITQAGLYPFRLLYYEGQFGASVEWYSINRSTGQPILINDPANTNSIRAYRSFPAVLLVNPAHSGHTSTFSFQTQAARNYTVQYKNALADALWQTLQTVAGNGSVTNITDNAATNKTRFYRVSSP